MIDVGQQTIERYQKLIQEKSKTFPNFLVDVQTDLSNSRVDDHVIRSAKGQKGAKQIQHLKNRILEERHETLFFIVHDEAHSAPSKGSLFNSFINDPQISEAPNFILLQVSATPYSLVTNNTRIPSENCTNWFRTDDAGEYFGIKVTVNIILAIC